MTEDETIKISRELKKNAGTTYLSRIVAQNLCPMVSVSADAATGF